MARHFAKIRPGEAAISIITYGELCYGAAKSQTPEQSLAKINDFVVLVPVLPLPVSAATCYGQLRAELNRQGTPIGMNDLWIAAHALALNVIVVSNNIREFSRIHGLSYENWTNS